MLISMCKSKIQDIGKILTASLIITLTITTFICSLLLIFSYQISTFFFPNFTTMPAHDKYDITTIFRLTAILLLVETVRLIIAAGLRGMQDVNFPLAINVIS